MSRGECDDYIVEGGFKIENSVGCAGYPRGVGLYDRSCAGGGVSSLVGLLFEEGDVVDADGEEGAETGGVGRNAGVYQRRDRERDGGQN